MSKKTHADLVEMGDDELERTAIDAAVDAIKTGFSYCPDLNDDDDLRKVAQLSAHAYVGVQVDSIPF